MSASYDRSPLRAPLLRTALKSDAPLLGTFVNMASWISAEVCAISGADWVLIDLEHGSGTEAEAGQAILSAAAYGVPAIVRVESAERVRAGRVLDAGASGVMFPRISSAAEAREAIRHLHYPPLGDRGAATYNRQAAFGTDAEALDRSTGRVVGIIQIETAGALASVEAIAALPGVDVLFVGPVDLSYALEAPRDFDSDCYWAAIDRVLAAAEANGKAAGVLVPNAKAAAPYLDRGYRFISIGSDSTVLAQAFLTEFSACRR